MKRGESVLIAHDRVVPRLYEEFVVSRGVGHGNGFHGNLILQVRGRTSIHLCRDENA